MQPGQLVTCTVGVDFEYFRLALTLPDFCPRYRMIYTVSQVIHNCPSCGQDHVTLEEFDPPFERGYPVRWFKPCKRPGDFDKFMEQVLPPPTEKRFEG